MEIQIDQKYVKERNWKEKATNRKKWRTVPKKTISGSKKMNSLSLPERIEQEIILK